VLFAGLAGNRQPASAAARQRGTGLGLPFVREVARLHGGQVQLANAPGGGAEARMQLPTS